MRSTYFIPILSYPNCIIKATIVAIRYVMSCSQAGRIISTDLSAKVTQARRQKIARICKQNFS